jgi:hypothetical protein
MEVASRLIAPNIVLKSTQSCGNASMNWLDQVTFDCSHRNLNRLGEHPSDDDPIRKPEVYNLA